MAQNNIKKTDIYNIITRIPHQQTADFELPCFYMSGKAARLPDNHSIKHVCLFRDSAFISRNRVASATAHYHNIPARFKASCF